MTELSDTYGGMSRGIAGSKTQSEHHHLCGHAHGIGKTPASAGSCLYNTRADLEAAMVKYAEDPIRWTSYWRKMKQ